MVTRSFSNREKIMLLILLILLVVLFYYLAIWKPTEDIIEASHASMDEVSDYLVIEEAKANSIAMMLEALDALEAPPVVNAVTPDYDNFPNLLDELNIALAETSNKSLSFSDPVFEESIVTRELQLSFDVENYTAAERIIVELYAGTYRNDIIAMKLTPVDPEANDLKDSPVNVTVVIIYYELYRAPANAE